MYGHSFWVTKIAYPKYFKNGTIDRMNSDVMVPGCGHGKWRNDVRPSGIRVDQRTIRKDVIIVPAGGYVVVEFPRKKNPGWWFMHCHIDYHLLNGMAIAIGEDLKCQNPPPKTLMNSTKEFCWTVEDFKKKERFNCSSVPNTVDDEEQLIPNEEDQFDIEGKMEDRKPPNKSQNFEEEWLSPKIIWRRFMKRWQNWH